MEETLRENERRLAAQNTRLSDMTAEYPRQTEVLRSILPRLPPGPRANWLYQKM